MPHGLLYIPKVCLFAPLTVLIILVSKEDFIVARYLSVDETAEILRTTDRTVRRMLNDGRLAGSQYMDKGKLVWRVHATKEILQKLESAFKADGISLEAIDAEEVEAEAALDSATPEQAENWQEAARSHAAGAVDEFWNQIASKFMERLEVKDQMIGEMRKELAEKERQLRLLPDLEKRAEEERKATELKELEAEALRKQISSMQEDQNAKAEELQRLIKIERELLPELQSQLDQERAQKQKEAAAAQKRLADLEKEKLEAEQARMKLEELETNLTETKRQADEQLTLLRKEKDEQTAAIQEQLVLITGKLEKTQRPWWKWWVTGGSGESGT